MLKRTKPRVPGPSIRLLARTLQVVVGSPPSQLLWAQGKGPGHLTPLLPTLPHQPSPSTYPIYSPCTSSWHHPSTSHTPLHTRPTRPTLTPHRPTSLHSTPPHRTKSNHAQPHSTTPNHPAPHHSHPTLKSHSPLPHPTSPSLHPRPTPLLHFDTWLCTAGGEAVLSLCAQLELQPDERRKALCEQATPCPTIPQHTMPGVALCARLERTVP